MCLDYALRVTEYGVWGGLTQRERAKLKRQRNMYVDDTTTQLENARLLRSSATAADLAQRFNVSERTIQRWRKDLAKQADAGSVTHFSAPSRPHEIEAA
jgi:DNA-binding CsgD family transcriptional regulator